MHVLNASKKSLYMINKKITNIIKFHTLLLGEYCRGGILLYANAFSSFLVFPLAELRVNFSFSREPLDWFDFTVNNT